VLLNEKRNMTAPDIDQLLEKFNCNPPSRTAAITEVETKSGLSLPVEYRDFLLYANGGEGFVGPNAYLILWRIEELVSMNTAYEVGLNAPGLFVFGSDGGGEAYAFDFQVESVPIVRLPFVGMERKAIHVEAAGFVAFLEALFRS
jgi:hypothetical protein